MYHTMRALSPHVAYSVQILPAVERMLTDQNGQSYLHIERLPVLANFSHGGVTPEEGTLALQRFSFSNLPEGTNPLTRIGVFDTELAGIQFGWDAETIAAAEEKLRAVALQTPQDLLVIEVATAPKPWPTYDTDDQDEIITIAQRLKLEDQVRAYEAENYGRSTILDALSGDGELVADEEVDTRALDVTV